MIDIEEYKPLIVKMAYALNQEHADDLISVGMLKLNDLATKFDGGRKTKFSTFVYKHVLGAMRDELSKRILWFKRKDKDFVMCYLNDLDEELFQESAEDLILSREKSGILRKNMSYLPEREKRIVILKYWNGMTNFEIACHLKLSESSVSQSHKKALTNLRIRLVDDGLTKK